MNIIGIHDGHNSAVCLLIDGVIKGLLQEERLVNEKNYGDFPFKSLERVLKDNNLTYNDIDFYVLNGYHMAAPASRMQAIQRRKEAKRITTTTKNILRNTFVYKIYKNKRKEERLKNLFKLDIPLKKIKFIEHHLAHASSAYFGCPWVNKNEKVLILTQDGSGDGLSGTVSIGYNGKIDRIASINKDDSLGAIYATTTFMLGMVPNEHEYKLMGMAPYSPESGMKQAYSVFNELLHFTEPDSMIWKRKSGLRPMQDIYAYLRKETEFMRFDWISAGLQEFTEDMLAQWVKNCIKHTGIHKVVLSGGTFMNVKANQKINELDEVEKLFIFPSCGDETNAIGAAYNVFYQNNPDKEITGLDHLYHGPDETTKEIVIQHLERFVIESSVKIDYQYHENVETEIAKLLSEGEIIARCKGPMEFGARALGNRSILSNASDLNKINVINNMIKKRDFWMPFAPVMLKERADEYIVNKKNMDAPYMITTFNTTSKYKEFIGGVQQVDLTARPQIIDNQMNPSYYNILKNYEKITGIGVLINTSFNLHGLPIVFGPKEALYVLENSGLKYLALGNFIIKKLEN